MPIGSSQDGWNNFLISGEEEEAKSVEMGKPNYTKIATWAKIMPAPCQGKFKKNSFASRLSLATNFISP